MISGVQLGIDVGKARIGVARSDALGMLAVPVATVVRQLEPVQFAADFEAAIVALAAGYAANPHTVSPDLQEICGFVSEYAVKQIVVGYPLNLRGEKTPATADAEYFAHALVAALRATDLDVPVYLVDERLSTKTAQQQLQQAGKTVKGSRNVIDQAAAVVILQHALDSAQFGGQPSGRKVSLAAGNEG